MQQKLLAVQKIRSKQDFDKVFADRKRLSARCLLAYYRCNELSYPRIGMVTAKRNIRLAVERNRVRRIIKEQFRLTQANLPAVDLVFVTKPGAGEFTNNELRECIGTLLTKLLKLPKSQSFG